MSKEKLKWDWSNGEITAGDFVFNQKGNLFNRTIEWLFDRKKYEEQAIQWMAFHFEFYGELLDEDYVTSGAILSCTCGSNPVTLQLPIDHGVIAPNEKPLMTCKDCEVGTNIGNFGICSCNPDKYRGIIPHPRRLSGAEDKEGKGNYNCFPV